MINKNVKINSKEKLIILFFLVNAQNPDSIKIKDHKWFYPNQIKKGIDEYKDDRGKKGISLMKILHACDKLVNKTRILIEDSHNYPRKDTKIYRLVKIKNEQETFLWLTKLYLGHYNEFTFIDTTFSKNCINKELGEYILNRLFNLTYDKNPSQKIKNEINNRAEDFIMKYGRFPSVLKWGLYETNNRISPEIEKRYFIRAVYNIAYNIKFLDEIRAPTNYDITNLIDEIKRYDYDQVKGSVI